jgi:DNA-binding transcriptional LysR family regulator
MQMLETAELEVFATIVAKSSLSRAATELRMPRATLSRKLAALEQRLGVRLLQRTTRSLRLTDAGTEFLRHAELVLAAARAAEASLKRPTTKLSGPVRVSMPPMTSSALPELLAGFARQHPEVALELHVANRRVDLRREGYDAAIRATGALEPGLVARTLSRVRLVGVASPAYLAAHGPPGSVKELSQHRILMGFDRDERAQTHWIVAGRRLKLSGALFSNDPHLVLRFALRGLGIAYLPATLVATPLARGELVLVLPQALRLEGAISIVHAEKKLMPPQVRAFVDYVIARGPSALSATSAADFVSD